MRASRRWPLLLLLALWGCTAAPPGATPPAAPPAVVPGAATRPPTSLSETQQVLHALNRLGYGPRPGDLEAVRRLGVAAWIEAQLQPERLDDRAVETRLAALRVPAMSPRALMDAYPLPQDVKRQGMEPRPEQSPQAMIGELGRARLLRAVYTERQLLEVMVDFWFNHFNVFAGKGTVRYYLPEYERAVIRPHALGRFRELLGAVAHHPAMLYYLDAWLSTAPDTQVGERRAGLNENYARELLELHTLGVDGGYTQADIVAVARALTGWTIDHPRPGHARSGGGFVFAPRAHDRGAKTILGYPFAAGGGPEEGERVLDLVARHPSAARFIATKLARRFVADDPPAALVERVAGVFRETDGDIRAVLRALVFSPEFFAAPAYRAKVKTPLEFTVSALRALGADTDAGPPVQRTLLGLGQPLYGAQPPTGYADRAEAWTSPGGLLARLNFAQALAADRLPGTTADLSAVLAGDGGAGAIAERLVERLLGGEVSAESRAVIHDALGQPAVLRATLDDPVSAPDVAKITALVLGSPEFQRR
ncbi:MAG: DUF1800 domain-containing protein [Candidatus Rokubacteria bacterium]|nr:DUF1800 domain-containing protein [Candidatus Rokubacteria bacterium]